MRLQHTLLGTAMLLLVGGGGAARQSLPHELDAVQFLVGGWQCADTVGDRAGTYTTTITPSLDGRWLRQIYDFPVSASLPKGLRGEFFIGFDARNGKWIRVGAMNDGMYFAMRGTRTGNVWSYRYVLPGTSGSAVYTKQSDTEYTVVGPTYPENGKSVTEHHGCRKVS